LKKSQSRHYARVTESSHSLLTAPTKRGILPAQITESNKNPKQTTQKRWNQQQEEKR